MTDHRDVIAAFLDHEPVEAPALEAALADADGREYFMDLLALRGLISNGGLHAVAGSIARPRTHEVARGHRKSALWLAAAAALVAVGTTGGYFAGKGSRVPAAPAIVVQPEPTTLGAPAPTHVIRLENGVTWNERKGGN